MEYILDVADSSAIEWTEATWNPTTGCDRVSSGCDNCYALRLAGRLKLMGQPHYQMDGAPQTSGPGFAVQTHRDALDLPRRWKRPRRIFVNSMSDLFHARIPLSFVREVFAVMQETPQHSYQLLTKRSTRLRRLAAELEWPANLWVGVTVESADQLHRVADLLQVPAVVRFVSAEPLLGPLTDLDLRHIDWLITGGESGTGYRQVDPLWVRELRDMSKATTTAFFFKQWGGRTPKAGGRLLDGELWDQMPEPVARTVITPAS